MFLSISLWLSDPDYSRSEDGISRFEDYHTITNKIVQQVKEPSIILALILYTPNDYDIERNISRVLSESFTGKILYKFFF